MGNGNIYVCSSCHRKYTILEGYGKTYSELYESKYKDVLDGKYGEDWKEKLESSENYALDCQYALYVCPGPECTRWANVPTMDIYEKTEEIKVALLLDTLSGGGNDDDEDYYKPWRPVFPWILNSYYKRKFIHYNRCKTCNRAMERVELTDTTELSCLYCKKKTNPPAGDYEWE